ncbi:MAG: IS1 family transposase [Flavobacteriales bacterium]
MGKACKFCNSACVRYGKDQLGCQRYRCKTCFKIQKTEYKYNACAIDIERGIIKGIRNGLGMRGLSDMLEVSVNTLKKRILLMSKTLNAGIIPMRKTYQVDELKTYIGKKKNEYWVAYAYCEETKSVIDITVGKRANKTLKKLIDTLLLSEAKKIKTDKLMNYKGLIPQHLPVVKNFGINHIERKNLTLRTYIGYSTHFFCSDEVSRAILKV